MPLDWDEWNRQQQIERQRWQEEEDRLHQPIHPKSDWLPASNPYDTRITFTPPATDSGYDSDDEDSGYEDRPYSNAAPFDPAKSLSGIAFIASLAAWPVLYPVSALVGFALAAFSYGMVEVRLGILRPGPKLALGLFAWSIGLIAAVIAGRKEHRLASFAVWRAPRHVLRLAIITFLAHIYAATELWPRRPPTSPIPGLELIRKPLYLVGLAGVAAVAHLILTRKPLRDWWHRRLEAVKLRPRS